MPSDRFLDDRMSILLDLIRGGAALAVLVGHAGQTGLLGHDWPLGSNFQHSAVVIFFVLSGLMIQQSASRPGMTLARFAAARAARILPVSLFALLLSAGLFVWLHPLGAFPATPPGYSRLTPAAVIMPLVFLSERSGGVGPVLDPPYWSLCYEIWFYAIFGIWTFLRGWTRWGLLAVAAVLADVPVLAMFPVWLIGVWLGVKGGDADLRRPGLALFLALLGFAAFSWTDLPIRWATLASVCGFDVSRLGFSACFATDAMAGACIAVAFASLRAMPGDPARLGGFARWIAGFSFTLYLIHWPLLMLIHHRVEPQFFPLRGALAIVGPIAVAALLAPLVERRLPRAVRAMWRRFQLGAGGVARSPAPRPAL